MTDAMTTEVEFADGVARFLDQLISRTARIILSDEEIAAAISGYSRVVAAQITASASAGGMMEQMASMMLSGGGGPPRDIEPDDANVLLYAGNDKVHGHTVSLTGGGKVVIIQDRENPGEVQVKFVREIAGESVIHTASFDGNGVKP